MTVEGIDELKAALKKLDKSLQGPASRSALMSGGSTLQEYIQGNIVDRDLVDTGNLLNKWTVKPESDRVVVIGTDTPYAPIHEYGGVVKAKNGKWLTFQTKDGSWHRVAAVQIPARPFVRPAVDEHKGDVSEAVGESLKASIARHTRR
jgi:HK97 gp10 family phage protein